MCGRFAFHSPHDTVAEVFGVELALAVEPRYNIAPSQFILAVREESSEQRSGVMLRWGLVPFWAKDPSIGNRMINARAETVAEKPAFRAAFKKRRCVIPADGFYEWKKMDGGKQPFYISAADQQPFAMAGLWESWGEGEEQLQTCTIITTGANEFIRPVHHRMPVILDTQAMAQWLDPANSDKSGLQELLQPAPDDFLQMRQVAKTVNNAANEGPELIEAR